MTHSGDYSRDKIVFSLCKLFTC